MMSVRVSWVCSFLVSSFNNYLSLQEEGGEGDSRNSMRAHMTEGKCKKYDIKEK